MWTDASRSAAVLAYHQRTKHGPRRFAASLGCLDWANQPDPFRRYQGAPLSLLPVPDLGDPLSYPELYQAGARAAEPLTVASLSRFLRYALSVTAWKELGGSRWALRANPSSGNLHPTEGYVVLPTLSGLGDVPAVYHYAPREHALERRIELDEKSFRRLVECWRETSFLAGLSSIHWREAWKYGERAYRYSELDAGHALGAMRVGAATLGWKVELLDGVSDDAVSSLLGLDREEDLGPAEREHPDLLVRVAPAGSASPSPALGSTWPDPDLLAHLRAAPSSGKANRLSAEHIADWPVIDAAAEAGLERGSPPAERPPREDFSDFPGEGELLGEPPTTAEPATAESVILGRRSAVAMDGVTSLPAAAWYRMLGRLTPSRDNRTCPWDTVPWRPRIHLGLFVHRVEGVEPGLYLLLRDPVKLGLLRQELRPEFGWRKPEGSPPALPLFLLAPGDMGVLARKLSCDQAIAQDGAFSLGMLAELEEGLAERGASFYRRLYWEAGLVGQILYLEAEAAGLRATGIGCFFDDAVHEVFGLRSARLQSLYHLAVGGPVEDDRLTALPGYER